MPDDVLDLNKNVKVLILEDSPEDAELMLSELEYAGFKLDSRVVDDDVAFESDLRHFNPDIILSDYSLPKTSGLEALMIAKRVAPAVPFIFVTGTVGEEIAADTILNGASGLLLKNNLTKLPKMVTDLLQSKSKASRLLKSAMEKINNRIKKNEEALSQIHTFMEGDSKIKQVAESIKFTINQLKEIQGDLKKS